MTAVELTARTHVMMISKIDVNLNRPAADRWHLTPTLVEQSRSLICSYLNDLGGIDQFGNTWDEYSQVFIQPDYRGEITSIAKQIRCSDKEVLVANLYYDLIKYMFGCTAFAVNTPNGPLHARNLDWWTENNMLSEYTLINHYQGQKSGMDFEAIGWPGFIGVFSGMGSGRFAITLNAVSSNEPMAFAQPIALLIREVFEHASSYREALDILVSREIASDCLLLISGTEENEIAVIERTPKQAKVREVEDGYLVVTNDYKCLGIHSGNSGDEIQATSCDRYDSALNRLQNHLPQTASECFEILSDPNIKMSITVQQMVFSASTGQIETKLSSQQETQSSLD